MINNKDIKVSKVQNKIFTCLLIIMWSITAIFTFEKKGYKDTLIIVGFGAGFILVFRIIQKYFIKMLTNYNKNLNMKEKETK